MRIGAFAKQPRILPEHIVLADETELHDPADSGHHDHFHNAVAQSERAIPAMMLDGSRSSATL
jgi:hypothetical protein